MSSAAQYWLMKSEPESYGIDHLRKDKKTAWTGVRNFQARNFMKDGMKKDDLVLYYHSNCKVPGIYGIATVVKEAYPDPTQFDPKSHYYDKRATEARPLWYLVDIAFEKKLTNPISLTTLRDTPDLGTMEILRRGSRLSVTSVSAAEYARLVPLLT